MVRVNNLVMATIDLGVNWYLQFLFRLIGKLLKVILYLKLEVRLTKVVKDSLWRHRGAKGTNMVRFRAKFITSKLNFIKNTKLTMLGHVNFITTNSFFKSSQHVLLEEGHQRVKTFSRHLCPTL